MGYAVPAALCDAPGSPPASRDDAEISIDVLPASLAPPLPPPSVASPAGAGGGPVADELGAGGCGVGVGGEGAQVLLLVQHSASKRMVAAPWSHWRASNAQLHHASRAGGKYSSNRRWVVGDGPKLAGRYLVSCGPALPREGGAGLLG